MKKNKKIEIIPKQNNDYVKQTVINANLNLDYETSNEIFVIRNEESNDLYNQN